jgi:hypothetical protein
MIKIIEDVSGLIKDDKFIYLTEYSQYANVYGSIQKAIRDNSSLTIVVKISAVMTWFDKLKYRYDNNVFEYENNYI